MKLSNVVTLVLFLFSSATALKIDLGIADLDLELDHLAVRILLNRGQPVVDGSFCSSEDEQLLQASLNQVLPFTRRNLRVGGGAEQHGRELVNFRQACQGFAPGSCYVVYSGCTRYRRELLVDEEEEQEGEEINTNEDTPRFLQRNMEGIELLFEKKCSGIMKRVENKLAAIIKDIDEELSPPCSTLVQKKMRVECELMMD